MMWLCQKLTLKFSSVLTFNCTRGFQIDWKCCLLTITNTNATSLVQKGIPLVDLAGAPLFHVVFWNIWQNHMLAPPPGRLAPLLWGILDPPLHSAVNCSRNNWLSDPPIDTSCLLQKLVKNNFLMKKGEMKFEWKQWRGLARCTRATLRVIYHWNFFLSQQPLLYILFNLQHVAR